MGKRRVVDQDRVKGRPIETSSEFDSSDDERLKRAQVIIEKRVKQKREAAEAAKKKAERKKSQKSSTDNTKVAEKVTLDLSAQGTPKKERKQRILKRVFDKESLKNRAGEFSQSNVGCTQERTATRIRAYRITSGYGSLLEVYELVPSTSVLPLLNMVRYEQKMLKIHRHRTQITGSPEEVHNETYKTFHGVFLLCARHPDHWGVTSIGYTVDPEQRMRVPRCGRIYAEGIRKTPDPWRMAVIVYGFDSDVTALHFEWTWKNPHLSRHLKDRFKRKSQGFSYCLKVLWALLRLPYFKRLPLIIRWPERRYALFPSERQNPPSQMRLLYKPLPNEDFKIWYRGLTDIPYHFCGLCREPLTANALQCDDKDCFAMYHPICFCAFLPERSPENILPLMGCCRSCRAPISWRKEITYVGENRYKYKYDSD